MRDKNDLAYWTDPNVDPESFHTSLMSVLPKKGDLSDPNKWRGMSLLSVASKLVSSIIATRLGKHFLDVGLDEQCGGVFGKGCIDGTYNVKQALHTLSQHGADSYVIFADLVKAYDTVDRELLWKVMSRCGCPEELIFVLRKLYTDVTIELKGLGKGFTTPSTVGVKQGDNLAPALFIFFINAVAESVEPEWEEAGTEVPWLSSYSDNGAKQEKRHGHSAKVGKRQKVFDFFLSYYVNDAALTSMKSSDFMALLKKKSAVGPPLSRGGLGLASVANWLPEGLTGLAGAMGNSTDVRLVRLENDSNECADERAVPCEPGRNAHISQQPTTESSVSQP